MKALKLSLLLCLGLFLSVGTLQAQAKKSCNQPCNKMKTAQAENAAASMVLMRGQSSEKAKQKCDPSNCDPKDCPPGCDISLCCKGAKTAQTGMGNGTTPVMKVNQMVGEGASQKDKKNCSKKCMKRCNKGQKTSASIDRQKSKVLAVESSVK